MAQVFSVSPTPGIHRHTPVRYPWVGPTAGGVGGRGKGHLTAHKTLKLLQGGVGPSGTHLPRSIPEQVASVGFV